MTASPASTASPAVARRGAQFRGPHAGIVAVIFTVLFNTGLYQVTMFSGRPFFPGPYQPVADMMKFFAERPHAATLCAFYHFGAAIALGIFTATVVSQLLCLGVRAAGAWIALFGGFLTSWNMAASACVLWATAHTGIAGDAMLTQALYYIQYAFGGPGFSVPMGLLMAGVCVTAWFRRLLPRWLCVFGLFLAICGELSWLNLVFPKTLPLIPLVRFPGFIWLMLAGFLLPRKIAPLNQ